MISVKTEMGVEPKLTVKPALQNYSRRGNTGDWGILVVSSSNRSVALASKVLLAFQATGR